MEPCIGTKVCTSSCSLPGRVHLGVEDLLHEVNIRPHPSMPGDWWVGGLLGGRGMRGRGMLGAGVVQYANSVYEGELKDGKPHGRGEGQVWN